MSYSSVTLRTCYSIVGFGSSPPSHNWGTILSIFDQLLADLQNAKVPAFLVRKLFQQLFSCVNVNLFNQLLLRRECCSFSNGEHVKSGLAEVEQWILKAGSTWVGDSWEQLKIHPTGISLILTIIKDNNNLHVRDR